MDDNKKYEDQINQLIKSQQSEDSESRSIQSIEEQYQQKKQENSLSLLTKKFIQLIKTKKDYTIDLNQASKVLEVQKRRIYDITNVMEGVGYVQKIHKNTIRWIGSTSDPQMGEQKVTMSVQIENLKQKEYNLDKAIRFVCERIKGDFQEQKQLIYIDNMDCQFLANNIFEDSNGIFIIKPSQNSIITSSSLTSSGLTEIIVQSQHPIRIISCIKNNQQDEEVNLRENSELENHLKWLPKQENHFNGMHSI